MCAGVSNTGRRCLELVAALLQSPREFIVVDEFARSIHPSTVVVVAWSVGRVGFGCVFWPAPLVGLLAVGSPRATPTRDGFVRRFLPALVIHDVRIAVGHVSGGWEL